MKICFSLKSLSFAFSGDQKKFFDDISIDVVKPGITFLLGKNGVGKSTFFRLLQGIVHRGEQLHGTLTLQNTSYDLGLVADCNRLHQRSMILHQSFDGMLAPSFTGLQNLKYSQFDENPGLSLVLVPHHVSEFVEQFKIPLDRPVYQLSGGQRQMLAMLMIAQKEVDLLLLDEPTAALDTKNSDYVMQGIQQLAVAKNIAVICIVHDMEIVQKYASNIIEISELSSGKKIFTTR